MAFEEGTDQLDCKACGAEHKARWYRMPVRDSAKLGCKKCGGVLFEGKSIREYHEVTLL